MTTNPPHDPGPAQRALCAEFDAFCLKHGLPKLPGDDPMLLNLMTSEQRHWFMDFVDRWDAATEQRPASEAATLLTIWREECARAPGFLSIPIAAKGLRFDERALVRIGGKIEQLARSSRTPAGDAFERIGVVALRLATDPGYRHRAAEDLLSIQALLTESPRLDAAEFEELMTESHETQQAMVERHDRELQEMQADLEQDSLDAKRYRFWRHHWRTQFALDGRRPGALTFRPGAPAKVQLVGPAAIDSALDNAIAVAEGQANG